MKRFKHYPKLAKERGQEGGVRLDVIFLENGTWQISTLKSSSYALLDAQAKASLERALLATPLPENLKALRFTLLFAIEFRLEDE